MNVADLTVTVRLRIGGQSVALWRVNALGFIARLLCVPVDVQVDGRR